MPHLSGFFTKIVPHVPLLVKAQLKCTPQFVQKPVLTAVFNQIFSHFLKDDELDFLEGKILCIIVHDIDYTLNITVIDQKIKVLGNVEDVDVTLSANFNELILMMARFEDPDTLFFHRKLAIEGNTAIGLGVKNWLDSMDMDILPKWCQTLLIQYAGEIQKQAQTVTVREQTKAF